MNLFELQATLGLNTREYEQGLDRAKSSMTQTAEASKKTLNQLRSDAGKLAQEYMKAGQTQSEAMKRAYAELKSTGEYETKMRKLAEAVGEVGDEAEETADKVEDFGDEAKDAANKPNTPWKTFGDTVKGVGDKIGGISAKAVAVGNLLSSVIEKAARGLVNLGKSAITASADIAAEQAQFKAAFGELEAAASGAFESISEDTGVLATRLMNVGTKAFSQFKGAGLDASSALSSMDKYTRLAADAAAYYDISIEDADTRLRSFIRGNTEAGDMIGLFTSESQRNSKAVELYGKKWNSLTEAQKQMLMLNVAEEIYTQSNVIGQAARESEEWTTVTGNLSEAWRQMLGKIGTPFRELLIPFLNKLKDVFANEEIGGRVQIMANALADAATPVFDGVIAFFDALIAWSSGEEKPGEMVTALQGIATALGEIAGKAYTGVVEVCKWLFNGLDEKTAENVTEFLSDFAGFFENPVVQGAAAVLLGIAGAFMLMHAPMVAISGGLAVIITRWKDIKEWAEKAREKLVAFVETHVPDGFLNAAATALQGIYDIVAGIKAMWDSFVESLKTENVEAAAASVQKNLNSGNIGGALKSAYDSAWWNPGNLLSGGSSSNSSFGGGSSTGSGRGFATGLDYVPYNDYAARLHEGEAVLTKAEAVRWRSGESGEKIDVTAMAAAIGEAVCAALDGAAVEMNGERVGDLLTRRVSKNIAKNMRQMRYATT